MELSIFLAKVLGLYLVITSLFMLIRHKLLMEMVEEFTESKVCLFVIAIITLILGILLVVSHNVWVMGWPVIITLFSWLFFIVGILRLFLIDKTKTLITWWQKHTKILFSIIIIYLIIGCYLLFMGFYN